MLIRYCREFQLSTLIGSVLPNIIFSLQSFVFMFASFLLGTNTHEGTVFVFTAYPTRMTKIVYQALVFSFFRASAPKILRIYAPLTKILSQSAYPDYRLVLSRIIGDYLFRCPNHYFAAQLAATGAAVYHYEFALATRTPGFPCCDGLACHTSELPYVFNQVLTCLVRCVLPEPIIAYHNGR